MLKTKTLDLIPWSIFFFYSIIIIICNTQYKMFVYRKQNTDNAASK